MIHWGEERLQRLEPHYGNFRRGMHRMMPRPEDGILPLRISRVKENMFFGNDPAGRSWEVHFVCTKDCDDNKIQPGKPVLFHGVIQSP